MEKLQYGISNSELAVVESIAAEIRTIFDKEFPGARERAEIYTSMRTLARFAEAREFNRNKTIEMWRNWVKWYESYRPDLIRADEEVIMKIHTSGKYRFVGRDREGCPILLIRMRYHIKGLATTDENLRYLLFMMEQGVRLAAEAGTYKLAVIFDRRNMAESDDVSSQSMKKFMPILNDCYPETLKAFYVLGANWFYRAMWAVVKIFISKKTEDKIHLLPEVEGKANADTELKKFVDPSNLADEYGGTMKISDSTRQVPLHPESEDKEDRSELERIKRQWS